jgi:hypothetical protein
MKIKYYGIFSKKDNYLHGVFPANKNGLKLAKNYLEKLSIGKNKKEFSIKIK